MKQKYTLPLLTLVLMASISVSEAKEMKIKITLQSTNERQSYTATLENNPTTQALLKQLPLSLPAENYGGVEKIAYLPQKLPPKPNPADNNYFTPKAGDVTYYAPWGNLALFHASSNGGEGLIYLGRFDSEFKPSPSAKQMRIERAE